MKARLQDCLRFTPPFRGYQWVHTKRGWAIHASPWEYRHPAGAFTVHAAPNDIYVLDFDGVLADSQLEVSSAGLEAATQRWPEVFSSRIKDASRWEAERSRVLAGLAATRPRLVKGYESMVMARLIADDNVNVDRILQSAWDTPDTGLLARCLMTWGEKETDLVAEFEGFRSKRALTDIAAWTAMSPLYRGVKEALSDCSAPWYVCSSKQGHRLISLLQAHLDLELTEDSPRLFHSLTPPNEKKAAALRAVMQRPIAADPNTVLHFIDDRYETIEAVASQQDLARRYKMYLAAWGYNTAEERGAASRLPGVQVITLPQFCELLRFQIIMEVDDGCQDTAEEALAAVYRPSMTVIE